ncbi:hypothetical protein AB4259_15075 [Vibrio amylolyticus]|uniref:hypothetical protein n=1 Tax=Vibrio TaxID=662 RepID=UPI000C8600B3|nr:hypothetical protein [Vibrio sp. 10N.261.55.A7]PMJ92949.1 hypothetical protein BCU12_06470 [Vibrio sp. 10N.261.55.A7]
MKTINVVISLILTLLLVGCGRVQPVMNVEDQPVAYNLTSKQVKSAIVDSAMNRGWVVEDIDSDSLSASIMVRSHSAKINVQYSEKYYSITYVSSSNLKASDGKIHRNYNRWINNLNVDIQKKLSFLAAQ